MQETMGSVFFGQELWRDFLSWAEAGGAQGLDQVMLGSMGYLYDTSPLRPYAACTLEVLCQENCLRGKGRWPSAWARG